MLLHQLASFEGRFEELSAERNDDELDAGPADRFLFDLSALVDDGFIAAQRAVALYRAKIEECGGRLVVVLPAGLDHLLDADLAPLVVNLVRPRGEVVFRKYLKAMGISFQPDQLTSPELEQLFAQAPMRDLARLSEMVRRARDSRHCGNSLSSWCDAAVSAVTNWSDAVARQVAAHRSVQERALLLTAAMFSGASADAVFLGTDRLLEKLDHQDDETPQLARADLGEQLKALKIDRAPDARVGFEQLAYDGAVRTHFWANFPHLRDALRDWVGHSMSLAELTSEDRMNLVARFAEQSLAVGRPHDLCSLTEQWTRPSARGTMRAEAAAALEYGLSHERYGGAFRTQIYEWVTSSRLAPDLVSVITGVCLQVMAATHADQALVRLHHLALRHGGENIEGPGSALLELAKSNRRMYQRFVRRLIARPDTSRSAAGSALLLGIVDPDGLRIMPAWPALSLAWSVVMAECPPAEWEPQVHHWLSAVAGAARWDPVLNVLLVATSGRRDLLSRLYVITGDWVRVSVQDRAIREATAARFWHKIDAIQGAGSMAVFHIEENSGGIT
ncbi:hypothetical protein [Streptomyces sp. NPDC088725]|uniref:hypothetical protein n=1 Tax=Streptomyces sp. NPDC088725 TaxID=3365873 RepID=UPI00381994B2